VYGGANMELNDDDENQAADAIADADYIIAQIEVPVPTIISAFKIARDNHATTILNPAPARDLSQDFLTLTDIIITSETEADLVRGIPVTSRESMHKNASYLLSLGMKLVIVTVGEQGTYYATAEAAGLIPSFKVKAVETTAAGETFIGALA